MKIIPSALVRPFGALCLLTLGLLSGGCASIIHGGPRTIAVNTQPAGAKATVTKEGGGVVSVNTTPFTIALEPKKGYFKGQPYNIKLELPGYRPVEVAVRPELSGWYFANIVFGGLIGMLIVDPATGSMWNLSPEKIEQSMSDTHAGLLRQGEGFVVVLLSDTTERERAEMVRVN
jgi:hypothetical protein